MREARCTWTLRGWRETLKDGSQVMRAEKISEEELKAEAEAYKQKQVLQAIYNPNMEFIE